jgi:hypothetical protein
MCWGTPAQNEEIRQNIDDVGGVEFPIDPDGLAFVGELVDQVEHSLAIPFRSGENSAANLSIPVILYRRADEPVSQAVV